MEEMASIPKYLMLNNGARMPTLGLGTFLAKSKELKEALEFALKIGYRHIDTAYSYENEAEIGEVLSQNLKSGKLSREDVFVTTKVPSVYLAPPDVEPCVLESLDNLQLKCLDMLLIHNPWGLKNMKDGKRKPTDDEGNLLLEHLDLNATWKVFEDMVLKGYAKGIGLSNFNERQISMIINNSRIKPANLQLECHAYLQQSRLRQFCANNDLVVTGYGPLGAPGRPADRKSPEDPDLLADPIINSIAKELGRSPGQILLRYIMQIGVIPLVKSSKLERIKENYDAQFFSLCDKNMDRIAGLNKNYKYFKFTWAAPHPEYDEGAEF